MEEKNTDTIKISIWDYLLLLLKWRRVIVFNVLAVGIAVGIISFIVPTWYTATTTILPPTKDSLNIGGASSLFKGLGALVGGGGGGFQLPSFTTPSDIYASILKSRTLTERIIIENNLKEVFDSEGGQELIKKVVSLRTVKVLKNGMITLSFDANDAQTAANVANSYIKILNDINQSLSSTRAGNSRRFIGERLEQTKEALIVAEENLRKFKEEHGAVDLTEQLKAQIQGAARLQSELALAEIELGISLESMSPENVTVKMLRTKVNQIKKQLRAFEGSGTEKDTLLFILPFSKAPELGLDLVRLMRELKIQEAIFELLTTQYEQAKITEAKDTPTIQVLDIAKPPERRSRPIRFKMVLMGMIGSFLFSIVVLFVIEYFNKMKFHNRETFDKFYAVVTMLRDDFNAMSKYIFKKKHRDTQAGS